MTIWVPEMWNMVVGLAIGALVWGIICLLTRR